MTPRELRAIRRQMDLTQAQMAVRIGIGTRTLQAYERRDAPVPVVVALAVERLAEKEKV